MNDYLITLQHKHHGGFIQNLVTAQSKYYAVEYLFSLHAGMPVEDNRLQLEEGLDKFSRRKLNQLQRDYVVYEIRLLPKR